LYETICVALPKVAKAITIVTVACRRFWRFRLRNIANVHEPLKPEGGKTIEIGLEHARFVVLVYFFLF
jgi:hypothetical protein